MNYNVSPIKNIYNQAYLLFNQARFYITKNSTWRKEIDEEKIRPLIKNIMDDMNWKRIDDKQLKDIKVRIIKEYDFMSNQAQADEPEILMSKAVSNMERKFTIKFISNEKLNQTNDPEFTKKKKEFIETQQKEITSVYFKNPEIIHLAKLIDEDMSKELTMQKFAELISLKYKAEIQTIISNTKQGKEDNKEVGPSDIADACLALTLLQKNEVFNKYLQDLQSYLNKNKNQPYEFVRVACLNYQLGINLISPEAK